MCGQGLGKWQEVSLYHFFLPTQAEKPDTAPGPNWSRCLPFSRRWPSKAWVSLHLLLCQHREVWHITPTPTPTGLCVESSPKAKAWDEENIPMVRKEVDIGERSSEYLLIEPTNWKEEKMKGRLKPSAIPHCLSHLKINWTLIKPLEKFFFPVFFLLCKTDSPLCPSWIGSFYSGSTLWSTSTVYLLTAIHVLKCLWEWSAGEEEIK